MTTATLLQWLAAMLAITGATQLVRARRLAEPLAAKNSRTSGALFLLSGAVFVALAADVI